MLRCRVDSHGRAAHLVRLRYGLELELGGGIVRVLVGVPLAGHLVVGLLDLRLGRILAHPKNRVVVLVPGRERRRTEITSRAPTTPKAAPTKPSGTTCAQRA
jgi:hypothetical protein